MSKLVSLVPLFPLIGFLITGLLGKKLSKGLAGIIASTAVLASFAVSVGIFAEVSGKAGFHENVRLFSWISSGDLNIDFSFLVDPLSSLFLLIITGVGFLIHVYSTGYMHHDNGHNRFFAYLNLFVFFMLLLVLGNNFLIMFVGWEGVGLCSYLLIGFWFKNTEYNNAAKKAFIMNRIGDLGFILGVILIFLTFNSISYDTVFGMLGNGGFVNKPALTAITLLLFIGAMGKSAQIPLYTWLPDAMAGPTPVSALIHAATMVTAGIYMVARSNIFFSLSIDPSGLDSSDVVAGIGLFTALFAATIGLFQNDIKKVLAYSTVSQLGYMFLALGVGAYTGAVFHVTTHAFFKALLFLGAGSVIHAMSGEQDIRFMGGLKKHLPVTHITFLLATLAISGIPPFSGFFSKDEILAHVYEYNKFFWLLGLIGSAMTTFYMFRLYFLTFHGDFRGTSDQLHHLHESPKSMTVPLVVLAVLSTIGGFMGLPHALGGHHWLSGFLDPVFGRSDAHLFLSHTTEYALMGIAVALAAVIIYFGYGYYVKRKNLPVQDESKMSSFQKVVYNKYYVDEIYSTLFTKPVDLLSTFFHKFVETKFIDAIVNGVGNTVNGLSSVFRLAQSGNIGYYLIAMVSAILLIFFIKFF